MKDKKQLPPHLEYIERIGVKTTNMSKEQRSEYLRLYRQQPHRIEHQHEYSIKYVANNKEQRKEWLREYRKRPDVKARQRINSLKWLSNNKEQQREYKRAYNKRKYHTDEEWSKHAKCRTWIGRAMKRQNLKKETWIKNIGCTKDEFIAHIESQFVEGMTWLNWSRDGWHLDHIIPLSKGGTNHYTNLQPLWAKENMSKSDKLI